MPRGVLREYLRLSGVAAIYLATLAEGGFRVGSSRDLDRTIYLLRRRYYGLRLATAVWVENKELAELIICEAMPRLNCDSGGTCEVARRDAERAIEAAAARLNVALTDHATVMRRVRRASFHVKRLIDDANARGELKWFNEAFREWRIASKSQGRSVSYAEARARLRRVVVQRVLAGDVENVVALTPEIFPQLSRVREQGH